MMARKKSVSSLRLFVTRSMICETNSGAEK